MGGLRKKGCATARWRNELKRKRRMEEWV